MSMMPMYKICPRCKRRYSWNPDVGKMSCPYCRGSGKSDMGYAKLNKIFKNRKK